MHYFYQENRQILVVVHTKNISYLQPVSMLAANLNLVFVLGLDLILSLSQQKLKNISAKARVNKKSFLLILYFSVNQIKPYCEINIYVKDWH